LLTAIVAKIIEKARAGDATAAKLLLDRLVPVPRARTVTLNLPSLADGTARSKASALAAVLDAMAAGQIDPSEAEVIAGLVERTGSAAQNCGGFGPRPPPTAEQIEYAKRNPAPAWSMLKGYG
jgi:hypothetical protein